VGPIGSSLDGKKFKARPWFGEGAKKEKEFLIVRCEIIINNIIMGNFRMVHAELNSRSMVAYDTIIFYGIITCVSYRYHLYVDILSSAV